MTLEEVKDRLEAILIRVKENNNYHFNLNGEILKDLKIDSENKYKDQEIVYSEGILNTIDTLTNNIDTELLKQFVNINRTSELVFNPKIDHPVCNS